MIESLKKFGRVLENESLKKYNTYKIGGTAKYVVFPSNENSLIELLKYLNSNNVKYLILGNGSNVILSDSDFSGVIIKLDEFNNIIIDNNTITVGAGVMLPKLVNISVNNNLKGLEWASSIPGTIGGSIVGNAGAYKSELFDFVKTIRIIDENYDIKEVSKDLIKHEYRHTEFKDNKKIIILGCTLLLENGDKEESLEIIKRRLEKRKETQPLEYPSAGSVFRNPEGDSAGRLIEFEAKLKGKELGGAQISNKHANFIINKNNAKSKDILELIDLVHEKVLENAGIDLILEQEVINWE